MVSRASSHVFLSYARKDDERFVQRLATDLRENGVEVWWDRDTMPSRGRTFLQELRDGIWHAGHVIAVIGPNAVRSAYVRAEWRHALLFSRVVVPVLRLGNLGDVPPELDRRAARLLPGLHTLDFRDDAAYESAVAQLLRVLREPLPRVGRLRSLPSLPPHFQPHVSIIERLEDDLLADAVAPRTVEEEARIAALVGLGGAGKSTLAAAFGRDVLTRRAFQDDIVWLKVGQKPDLLALMNRLDAAIVQRPSRYADEARAQDGLAEALEGRVTLIVLDDVWRLEAVEPFVAMLGPRCRLLVTTRDSGLAGALGAGIHRVEPLEDEEALTLIAAWAGCEPTDLPEKALQSAGACGNLPFALAQCGAMARSGTPWADIHEALRTVDLSFIRKKLKNYPDLDLMRALAVGVQFLDGEDPQLAARYRELAVLPPDVAVAESGLARLWKSALEPRRARRALGELAEKALLHTEGEAPNRRVTLHTLQHDYLRAVTQDLPALHEQMLDAYETTCGGHWSRGENDGYFYQHLVYHLHGAERTATTDALLVDPEWLCAKLAATDVVALGADFRCLSPGSISGAAVRDALRLAAYRVAEDPALLVGQILGRLLTCTSPPSKQVVKAFAAYRGATWLRPSTVALSQVGGPLQRILTRGSHMISCIAVCADGSVAVTSAVADLNLKLWDLRNGTLARTLPNARRYAVIEISTYSGPVDAVAISVDGKHAVSALDSSQVRVWDLTQGRCVRTLTEHARKVMGLVWRDDGRVTSVDRSGAIRVWDPESLDVEREHPGPATWLISPDGRQVVLEDGSLLEVDTATVGPSLQGFALETHGNAFSADGRTLLGFARDGTARWWDLGSGALRGEIPGIAPEARCAVLCGDAREAIIGRGNRVLAWPIGTARARTELAAHVEACTSLAVPRDERLLLSGSLELAQWDLQRIRCGGGDLTPSDPVARTALRGRRYATGSVAGVVTVRDVATGELLHEAAYPIQGVGNAIEALAFTADGEGLLIATGEGLIALRTFRDWGHEQIHRRGFVRALLPGANRVATTGKPSFDILSVWDVRTGEASCTLEGYRHHPRSAFSPDGRRVILATDRDGIAIVDLDDGRRLRAIDDCQSDSMVATADNRHVIASDALEKQLVLIDLATGETVVRVRKDVGFSSEAIALTHDASTLLAADDDGVVSAWEVQTGRIRYEFRPHESFVGQILVSRDDRLAVSLGLYDGVVQVWEARSGTPLARFVAEGYFCDGHISPSGATIVAAGLEHPVVLHLHERR